MSHCSDVISQFFQPFYHKRIERVYTSPTDQQKTFDIAIFKFWCSVIDLYGGIYYVGKTGQVQMQRGRQVLATGESFSLFIKDFFPAPEMHYGKFIYSIFRSGIVHQLSPKRSGIHWMHSSRQELIWVEVDPLNTDPNQDKKAHINLQKFQELTYAAYIQFYNNIKTSSDPTICNNIYTLLINVPDIFNDGAALDREYNNLLTAGYDIKRP
jgi:hypothetical protein